ncbi:unnamed protein product [Microthlaspi erraticum]|uniref:Uncharacterized protein n=1 Tax=Microthlaspi erraticum TaxID=1685480 RepID=A0A6D2J7W2_9BRAS|nr:unnamed protein product [Microthlaspi erraticum]
MGDQPLTKADFQGFTVALTSALTALTNQMKVLTNQTEALTNKVIKAGQRERRGERIRVLHVQDNSVEFSNHMNMLIDRLKIAGKSQKIDKEGDSIRVPRDENNCVVVIENPSSLEEDFVEKEIDQQNLHDNNAFHTKADISLSYEIPEVEKTEVPEGVLVIYKDFKKLIADEQGKKKIDVGKQKGTKVFKEDDDLIVFLHNKKFSACYSRVFRLRHLQVSFSHISTHHHRSILHHTSKLWPFEASRPTPRRRRDIGILDSRQRQFAYFGPVLYNFGLRPCPVHWSSVLKKSISRKLPSTCFKASPTDVAAHFDSKVSKLREIVRRLIAGMFPILLVWELFNISTSSVGMERSLPPSSLYRERNSPPLPFSMRSGYFSESHPSKLYNLLTFLSSCISVYMELEDATRFDSSNLGGRNCFSTSPLISMIVTRLQKSGQAVMYLPTRLSFAYNLLSFEDLSSYALIFLCCMVVFKEDV